MEHIVSTIELAASQNQPLAFLVIYFLTILLGNIAAFLAFWVALQGYLGHYGPLILIVVLFLSDISADLLWYTLGYKLRGTRVGEFLKNHLPGHARIEKHIYENGERWTFLSKFIYASSFPIIFMVGWSHFDFRRFFRTSLIAIITSLPILIILAYGLFSSLAPLRAGAMFHRFERILGIGLLLFILLNYAIKRIITLAFDRGGE